MAIQTFEKVAVLFGGTSAEREISLKSGRAVLSALLRSGINAVAVDPADGKLMDLKRDGFSHAFIALHGRGGEDGVVQGALQLMELPYTGSNVQGSALGMDKILCKQVWQSLQLPTAPFAILTRHELDEAKAVDIISQMNFDAIVKPAKEGSSIGMARVKSAEQLLTAAQEAFRYDQRILVERWINGSEYTVAILGEEALPAIRMITDHDFYDYDAKYLSNTTQYLCPCGLGGDDEQKMQSLALSAFQAVGCSGWGRVDFMRDDATGEFYLLEVNTAPGMTEKSLVPMAAKARGISFDQLVCKVLAMAKCE